MCVHSLTKPKFIKCVQYDLTCCILPQIPLSLKHLEVTLMLNFENLQSLHITCCSANALFMFTCDFRNFKICPNIHTLVLRFSDENFLTEPLIRKIGKLRSLKTLKILSKCRFSLGKFAHIHIPVLDFTECPSMISVRFEDWLLHIPTVRLPQVSDLSTCK